MSHADAEDAQFQKEVEEVKQWWTDSRWRFTRRTFTAEEIVAKRGNLKIQYPSNSQSKKLWNIVEDRFKVRTILNVFKLSLTARRTTMSALHMAVSTPSWSPKWQSTWIPCMSLDGKLRQQLRPLTSLGQIWLITPT
jgi:hypothetical protein